MIRCRVLKVDWNGKWACVVWHGGKAVGCQHFPTWADAYRYARDQVG